MKSVVSRSICNRLLKQTELENIYRINSVLLKKSDDFVKVNFFESNFGYIFVYSLMQCNRLFDLMFEILKRK